MPKYPSEAIEQTYLFAWIRRMRQTDPRYNAVFHIPNGGKRSRKTGAELKAQGAEPGVPDILVSVPSQGFPGLWIELKSQDPKSTTSPEQRRMLAILKRQGYKTMVCRGCKHARKEIAAYLNTDITEQPFTVP